MPVPARARSLSRVSNWAVKPRWPRISSGMPRSARIWCRTPFRAGSWSSSEPTPLGSASVRRLSMRMAMCGACAALAKVLRTSPERCDLGAMRWKAWPSRPGWWAMWSIARGHVVDRDDVRVAELEADEREPLGQRVARLLERLEEVVGPVDLVHLAGLRVADDDRRPVDAPRDARLLARDLLGLELRAVVGRRQLLALVEHVLAEHALVGAGDRRPTRRGAGCPASSALASATALRVPVTLARSLSSSSAVMS